MAYLLFVDESGQDRRESPYEVLAGLAIEDRDLWNLVLAIRDSELRHFGCRYSDGARELKARKLLKRKTFMLAGQLEALNPQERTELAKRALQHGDAPTKRQLTALAQAKLAFVADLLDIAARFRCRAFASIVNPNSPQINPEFHLRKDYAYLFERFFYFLEDTNRDVMGVVVFDEVEASKSIRLLDQMHYYFLRTLKGRARASQIIPEPLFVRSELVSGVQLADIIAYIVSWGFRTNAMGLPRREELAGLVDQVCDLRYRATREVAGNPEFVIWSFSWIEDLRTAQGG